MPKKDISLIADELWWICKEYNGIPSQTVDKKSYSKALYCLKTYGDYPEIKDVIKEYNLSLPRTKRRGISGLPLGLEDVKKILEERGRMPLCPEENLLYHKVRYFFKKNAENEEVKRLKMIYASGDVCPLYERTGHLSLERWRSSALERVRKSMKYVLDTYRIYKVFPAVNTAPMKRVRKLLEQPSLFLPWGYYTIYVISEEEFSKFLGELIDLGCQDEMVINNWNKLNKTNEL